jgi:hypothetical protein
MFGRKRQDHAPEKIRRRTGGRGGVYGVPIGDVDAEPDEYRTPLRAPLEGYWKHEFASHCVVYRIYQERKLAVVCAVGPRKEGDVADIYRKLEAAEKVGKLAQQAREALDKYIRRR